MDVPEMDGDLVALLRTRATRLLSAWTNANSAGPVFVAGSPLTAGIVTSTGALEIAVHGWDVAGACGASRPIPAALAEELLELARFFVTGEDRPARFAAPVRPRTSSPGDVLLAYLGRRA